MKANASEEEFKLLFPSLPKKKGKTIGNPPPLNQQPYRPRKATKK
jgi:hypothetical protein